MKKINVRLLSIIFLGSIFLFLSSNPHAQLSAFNNFNPAYVSSPLGTNPINLSWINQYTLSSFTPLFPANTFQSGNSYFSNLILPSSPFSFITQNKPFYTPWQPSLTIFPEPSPPFIFPWEKNGWISPSQVMPWYMPAESPKIEQVINESFNNQTIYVTQGNLIKIELSSNPSTGYTWFETFDLSKFSLYDHSYSSSFTGLLGAGGKDVWILKALTSGKASISFEYKPQWKPADTPVQKVTFTIIITTEAGLNELMGKESSFISAGDDSQVYSTYSGAMYGSSAMAAPEEITRDAQSQIAREIEEADIIKIEGTYLYILNRYRGLIICDISKPDTPFIAGRVGIPSGDPKDMYINGNKAYIIVNSINNTMYYATDVFNAEAQENGLIPPGQSSSVVILDIANKSRPAILTSFEVEGNVTDSRIVGAILYLVSSEQAIYYARPMPVVFVEEPAVASTGMFTAEVPPTDIATAIAPVPAINETTATVTPSGEAITVGYDAVMPEAPAQDIHVISLDISDSDTIRSGKVQYVDRVNFSGYTNYINVTDQAIFIESRNNSYPQESTDITYIDISDPTGTIEVRGTIEISGTIQDKFKMDYYNGYLRVCTYQWNREGGLSTLYTIDVQNPDALKVVGSVSLGSGEQLFATRFDGDRGYLVTFERIDPLWVIDLSDPSNPAIKGELEVPGWSTHIEPRDDRLIALGVDNSNGRMVSVSLFDVGNPERPGLIERISFGEDNGWSSSEAYSDVKALTVIDDMGLILLPYSTSVNTDGRYMQENRLQLIDFSKNDIEARGWISQKGSIQRSRSIANRLFSVSTEELQVIDATNRDKPKITGSLPLARNIIDIAPLDNGYSVQLLSENYSTYSLAAISLADPEDGPVVSEIEIGVDSQPSLIANGNMVYVLTTDYNTYYPTLIEPAMPVREAAIISTEVPALGSTTVLDEPAGISIGTAIAFEEPADLPPEPTLDSTKPAIAPDYYYPVASTRVQIFDFSTISRPQKRGYVDLTGTYNNTRILGGTMPISSSDYNTYNVIQIDKDVLVFNQNQPYYYLDRYYMGVQETDDGSIKNEEFRGFIVVDLSNPDKPEVAARIPSDDVNPRSLFAKDQILYYSYSLDIEKDDKERLLSEYYLGGVDLSDPYHPVTLKDINIPGYCVGLSGDFAYTINMEWSSEDEDSYYKDYSFNVVKLVDDTAYLFDTINLEGDWYTTIIDSGYAYLSGTVYRRSNNYYSPYGYYARPYYGGYGEFIIIDLSNPEKLVDHKHSLSGGNFDIFGAQKKTIFAGINGAIACYSVADPEHPELKESKPTYSSKIVFKANKAYIPLGYYGLWVWSL